MIWRGDFDWLPRHSYLGFDPGPSPMYSTCINEATRSRLRYVLYIQRHCTYYNIVSQFSNIKKDFTVYKTLHSFMTLHLYLYPHHLDLELLIVDTFSE